MIFSSKNEVVGPNFDLTETVAAQSNIWSLIPLFFYFWIPTLLFPSPRPKHKPLPNYSAAVISKCAEGDVLKQEQANFF